MGFLTVPYLIEHVGWIGLLIAYPIVSFSIIIGIAMLNKTADDIKYTGGSYENLMRMVLGKSAYYLTRWVLSVNQICTCIANIMFCVNFLDFIFCQHNIQSLCGERWLYTIYAFILSCPIIFITNLKYFSNVSFLAITSILTAIIAIIVYDIKSMVKQGVHWNH